ASSPPALAASGNLWTYRACSIESCRDPPDLHSFPTRRSSDLYPSGGSRHEHALDVPADRQRGGAGRLARGGGLDRCGGADEHGRSEEHTSELQSRENLVCRLLLEKKKTSGSRLNELCCGSIRL